MADVKKDMREYKEVVKAAVARERRCDQLWSWRIHSIGKENAKIDCGYLSDCLHAKHDHFMVEAGHDDELGGYVVGIVPNGHKVILFIGDSRWDDFKTFEEGIACAIHSMAEYAHSRY